MNIFRSLLVCLAMYSIIPVRGVEWTKENMKYSFCFFPFIGLLIGACCFGMYQLLARLAFDNIFISIILLLISVVLSGGIHLDGFIDTCDAIFSYGDKEKKLQILKDPNAGAFGVIGCVVYFMLLLAAFIQIVEEGRFLAVLPVAFILSRTLGIMALLTIRKARSDGLGSDFSGASHMRINMGTSILWLIASFSWIFVINIPMLCLIFAMLAALYALYYYGITKQFGGITGDLTGFLIMSTELAVLMGIALGGRLIC